MTKTQARKAALIAGAGGRCQACGRSIMAYNEIAALPDDQRNWSMTASEVAEPDGAGLPLGIMICCKSCASTAGAGRVHGGDIRDVFGRSFLGGIPKMTAGAPKIMTARVHQLLASLSGQIPTFGFVFWYERGMRNHASAVMNGEEYPIRTPEGAA